MFSLESARARARASRLLPDPATRKAIRVGARMPRREVAGVVGAFERAVQYWEEGSRTPTGTRLERYAELLEALREELGSP
jgi:DNA-binding transcriptional regulator YiaG